jgi:hypothetical protein
VLAVALLATAKPRSTKLLEVLPQELALALLAA